jgi:hypothetical protein
MESTKSVQPQKLVFHIPSGRDVEVTQAEWDEIQAILTAHTRERNEDAEAN